ncbi:MAG TPA: NADH-quinone oxidoreductase subunit L [Candidatus Paceibacterota bacterium]|nr:NADH-quinone oxidoreductase subunit L [Verrucomicrobiota bacterium]HSA08860.1 NADH-quinone oxidoreductase subunit L [Candidatus Paceibacterota bacterium]
MRPDLIPWIILFLPLLAAAVITLFTQHDRKLSAGLSTGAVVAGFLLSILFVGLTGWESRPDSSVTWLTIGGLHVDFGLRFDPLSLLMLLVVTGVASAIHIYSWGYMSEDRGFPRYFACLSFFTFSMLGIVLANNFLELFIFWELVGVSSYLLIGFWFERPAAADAGKKAFVTTRLGDFGFLLGIMMVWTTFSSLRFADIENAPASNPQALGALATAAGLLIFCGAMGKSAQFPLHVWLPDAMEGPTPVSALIHAATMVAAGVYMLCRVFFIFTPDALTMIAWIGAFTALLSAVIAVQQNDIKRILAYSTLSQLGYMVMAVGLLAPAPAMFHLTTHAFFKALLFLGAGSVIIALHHEQDIWNMGGLRAKMPVTFWTFMTGTLALAGLPPFSGFYSKDSILAHAAQHSPVLFALGAVVAALTTFYMFRLVFVAFLGAPKSEAAGRAHESPPVMAWPLRILAVFSVIGGLIGVEQLYGRQFPGEHVEPSVSFAGKLFAPFIHAPLAAGSGLLAVLVGFAAAYALYAKAAKDPLPEMLGALARAMRNRFYLDELYQATVIRLHDCMAAIADWFDRWIIAGVGVRGTHGTTELAGRALRLLQTGNLQTYTFLFALGVALILYLVLF